MRALFIDFDDSFSFNVVQELTEAGLEVDVLHWRHFGYQEADLLVLGPGPGHPDDYQEIFPMIETWLSKGKKVFAVCLGHQILWRLKGKEVQRSAYPLHGQKIELSLNDDWSEWLGLNGVARVQRYNSLAVLGGSQESGMINHVEDGEIVISRSFQVISYQFHPESVGTNCRASFFRVIYTHLL